jgi:hypothetical protein
LSGERPTPRVNPAAAILAAAAAWIGGRGFLQPDRETVKGTRRDRRGRLFAPSGKGWHRVLGQTYEGASMRRLLALFPTVRTRLVAGRWEIFEPATGFVRGRGRRPRQAIRAALHGRSGRRVKLTLEEWQKLDRPGA